MNIEELRNIDAKTLNLVIRDKGSNHHGLTPAMVDYILTLNSSAEIMREGDTNGSQLDVARKLQEQYPSMSLRTARRRVSDCIRFLYSESNNTSEEWHEFYADKMDALAKEAERNGDLKTAMQCYSTAHEYRVLAAAGRVDPERVKYKRIIVSPDVAAGRMGLDDSGMRELMQRAYSLIDKSDLPQREKERLQKETSLETGIEEAEIIDNN